MAYRSLKGKKKFKNICNFIVRVESTKNGKLWRLSGRFQTLIWSLRDTVQNQEYPGLSGRVDSTGLPCLSLNPCVVPMRENFFRPYYK